MWWTLLLACTRPGAPTWAPWGPTGLAVPALIPGAHRLVCDGGSEHWEEDLAGPDVFRWSGLVPATAYACALDGRPFSVALADAPESLPQPVVTGETAGWVLFNHVRDCVEPRLVVLDDAGRVRWWHDLAEDPDAGIEAKWLPDGPLGPAILAGGGDLLPPQFIGVNGATLWSAPPRGVAGGVWHHDTAWLADRGVVLGLSEAATTSEFTPIPWTGFALETLDPIAGGRTGWWVAQQAVNAGTLQAAPPNSDPYHANAVEWHPDDPDGPATWISLKRTHEIVRMAEDGTLDWTLGVGGDFRLFKADGSPGTVADWFWGQHAPEAAPTQDPDVWTVWVHDNGFDRPAVELYSRVMLLEVDLAARTATLAWEWTEPGWYEPVFGDVDQLPDGHILLAMGHCAQCPEAPPDRGSAILEIDPTSREVIWEARLTSQETLYRADRVDPCSWAPQNRTACNTASEIAAP